MAMPDDSACRPQPCPLEGRRLVPWWQARATWRRGVIIAAAWLLVILRLWDSHLWALPGYLTVAAMAAVLADVDQRTLELPNRLTGPTFAAAIVLLGAAAVVDGEPERILRALGAAASTLLVCVLLAWRGGLGWGDVKFAPTIALALGWLSWPSLLVGMSAAILLAGLVAVLLVTICRRERTTQFAFGPWLTLGALVGIVTSG